MKFVAFAFFAILFHAHTEGDLEQLLGQPLRVFRDPSATNSVLKRTDR